MDGGQRKRRKVMNRSMKLGHCICDPKKPCPCPLFTDKGLCPCAGDRPEPMAEVKLTQLVHNTGCASKIAATDLERFLARLPHGDDPNIISGLANGDDAGVYRLTDTLSLVQTVDVFTPCVDDPYQFGKICAANCLSDIYAMGGTPKTALSVLAFPIERLDGNIMYEMMRGATEVLQSVGCSLLGGHSIKDEEIKLGFAITGILEHQKATELENAQVGDRLYLTKPLGVGIKNFAYQINLLAEEQMQDVIGSMRTLNDQASAAMMEVGVSACTDITGFGLFGHLIRLAHKAGVTARIFAESLPLFSDVHSLINKGVIPGAIERNSEFVGQDLFVGDGVTDADQYVGFDAQTSGGLLLSVPAERAHKLESSLESRGVPVHYIGCITAESDGFIELVKSEVATDTFLDSQSAMTDRSLPF